MKTKGLETRLRPYGVQLELLARAGVDHDGLARFHQFPKAWEAFEIEGHLDPARLERAIERAFQGTDTLTSPIPGYPPGRVAPARHGTHCVDDRATARQLFRQTVVQLAYDRNDLLAGARPWSLLVCSGSYSILAFGADHAFLDGYSLTLLLRNIAEEYGTIKDSRGLAVEASYLSRIAAIQQEAGLDDLKAHVKRCPAPHASLRMTGEIQIAPQEWHAHDEAHFTLTPEDSQSLIEWCARHEVSPGGVWRSLVQFVASAWVAAPLPVLYSRLGRPSLKSLHVVGPLSESVVAAAVPFVDGEFGSWVAAAADRSLEGPPLHGNWLSELVGQGGLDKYRLVSFNYYPPARATRMGAAAIAQSADPELVAGLTSREPVQLEKRNGIVVTVCRTREGLFEVWLLADPRIVGPAVDFGRALNEASKSLAKGLNVNDVKSRIRGVLEGKR